MTLRIDFYLLNEIQQPEQVIFALVNKAYQQGWRIGLHLNDGELAKHLDETLWSQSANSFIPHQIITASRCQSSEEAVLLFHHAPDDINTMDYYINFTGAMVDYNNPNGRIADIVANDETAKTNGRERYSHYKKQTCELHHHSL